MKKLLILFVFICLAPNALSQIMFSNPIIPGFNPDPSITRVGDDYYLVTSSWEYSPSIPIYHSKDLVNWNIINYVATTKEQLNLNDYESYGGVWAPTIRYNNGIFYVTASLVKREPGLGAKEIKNVLFTTEDINGQWSLPIVLTDQVEAGIDPSLFFDDNGKSYLLLNRPPLSLSKTRSKIREIYIQEVDLKSKKLVGSQHILTRGFAAQSKYAEGPHIYQKDGYYYLLISEGGTGYNHAVTISRSREIFGPYIQNDANPLLTHRNLGKNYPIQNVGHADFIQTQNGEWWSVVLGIRLTDDGTHSIMGRETFLTPMVWEKNQWPVMSPMNGVVPEHFSAPNLPVHKIKPERVRDKFDQRKLALHWNFLRTPLQPFHSFDKGLKLNLLPTKITEQSTPAFVGRRITTSNFTALVKLEFSAQNHMEEAGLVIISSHFENYRFVVKGQQLQVIAHKNSDKLLASIKIDPAKSHYLNIKSDNERFSFNYSSDNQTWQSIVTDASSDVLGFRHTTGDYIAMYASANGKKSSNQATFKWFEYTP